MTLEGKVKAAVKKVLSKYPGIYSFMPVQTGYGTKSLDFLLCVAGVFVAVETKAPGKVPTELQWKTIGEIQLAGGIALVIDSKESATKLDELIQRLRDHHPHATHQPDTSFKETQDAGRPRRRRCAEPFSARETAKLCERHQASLAAWINRNLHAP